MKIINLFIEFQKSLYINSGHGSTFLNKTKVQQNAESECRNLEKFNSLTRFVTKNKNCYITECTSLV